MTEADSPPEPQQQTDVDPDPEASPTEAPSTLETLLGQVLPPLVFLPLIVLPLDMPTALFWLAAGLCLLVSCISAVIRLLTIGFGASSLRRRRLLTLIRPTLTILIVCAARICTQHSLYVAEHEVAVAAEAIQREAQRAGVYPETLPDWRTGTSGDSKCSRRLFGWTADHQATYVRDEDGRGFVISLHVNMDTSLVLSAGAERELSAVLGNHVIGPQDLSVEELLAR